MRERFWLGVGKCRYWRIKMYRENVLKCQEDHFSAKKILNTLFFRSMKKEITKIVQTATFAVVFLKGKIWGVLRRKNRKMEQETQLHSNTFRRRSAKFFERTFNKRFSQKVLLWYKKRYWWGPWWKNSSR